MSGDDVRDDRDGYGRFAALVEAVTGIQLGEVARSRVSRVLQTRKSARGIADVDTYLALLEEKRLPEELQALVNVVTVGKTAFARYPRQVSVVTEHLVPALDHLLPPGQPINIWSAATSTGEEAYTLAMALSAAGWYERRPFTIVGSDINTDALAHARAGRYTLGRHVALPDYVHHHLDREGPSTFRVARRIRDRVVFRHINLRRDPIPDLGGWHIIVCANVFIYFAETTSQRIIDAMRNAMAPWAALTVGGAETLQAVGRGDLWLAGFGDAFCYLQGDWRDQLHGHTVLLPPGDWAACAPPKERRRVSVAAAPALARRRAGDDDGKRRRVKGTRRSTQRRPRLVASHGRTPAGASARSGRHKRDIGEATKRAAPAAAPVRVEPADGADAEVALRHLEAGELLRAAQALEKGIDADPLAFELHFFLGRTYLALDRTLDAQETLRRALFLEPSFALARYTFALALHRGGEIERAIDEYARTARTRTEPQLIERLRQRAGATGEALWVDDSFVAELCRANSERARRGEPPLGTTLPAIGSPPRR